MEDVSAVAMIVVPPTGMLPLTAPEASGGTYGAPELTAAAIEDLKRGDVVGERTFGEGAVQRTIDLPDGAALMLTVAKYQEPDGKKIQDDAVTPNVVVASPEDDGEPMPPSNADDQLNQALNLLKAKNS